MAAKTRKKLKIGFIMDPLDNINLQTDTTFVMMMEAQKRKHQNFYMTPGDLWIENGAPMAIMAPVKVKWPSSPRASHFSRQPTMAAALSELDLIFMRVDPPYSLEYVTMVQILNLVPPPSLVINRPRGLLMANEKILAQNFPDLMPPTMVSRDPERLDDFLHDVGGKIVVKPLSGFGGIGVLVVEEKHTNRRAILENVTGGGNSLVMAQKYLPVTQKGDKRIILLSGEPVGAVLRMPKKGDHRANLHSGGTYHKTSITARDREICARVGAWVKREGLWIVGLDVVADYLTEVNVTSPTLVQQINEVDQTKLEERILDFTEYLAETARSVARS